MQIPFNHLIDFTKELVIIIDTEGNIIYANKTAQITLGLNEEAIKSKNITQFLSEKNYFNVSEKVLTSSHNTHFEDVIFKKFDRKEFFGNIHLCHLDIKGEWRALFVTDLTYRYEFRKEITEKVKVIETLSKSSIVRGGGFIEAIHEVLRKSLFALDVQRVNIWLSDENQTFIRCIGSCIQKDNEIILDSMKELKLFRKDYPLYFNMLFSEEVIITDDVLNDPQTYELKDNYLIPNSISSMLDVPLRSDGKMIGVVCFEHIGHIRKWNVFEVKFGFLIAQIISLLIESYERTKLVKQQHKLLLENKQLMEEISYRVKYSFSLMNRLLSYHAEKYKESPGSHFVSDIKNQLQSISGVHEIVFEASDYTKIDINNFVYRINALTDQLYGNNRDFEVMINIDKNVKLPINKALPTALLINELLCNSYIHSFPLNSSGKIKIRMGIQNHQCSLSYFDDGVPFNQEKEDNEKLSHALIDFFTKDLKGTLEIYEKDGNFVNISFPL